MARSTGSFPCCLSFRLLRFFGRGRPVPVGLAVGERRYVAVTLDVGDPHLFDPVDTPRPESLNEVVASHQLPPEAFFDNLAVLDHLQGFRRDDIADPRALILSDGDENAQEKERRGADEPRKERVVARGERPGDALGYDQQEDEVERGHAAGPGVSYPSSPARLEKNLRYPTVFRVDPGDL